VSDQPLPKSRRRRLRFSVSGLMALVLILGRGLGWILYRARVQREAVAVIKRVGGQFAYNWRWSNAMPIFPRPKGGWPESVRRTFDPDVLNTVTYVRLNGSECDDEALRAACRFLWLQALTVINTSVTDAGAEELWRLKILRTLDLRLNRISGRPPRRIGEMSELLKLSLAMRLSPVPLTAHCELLDTSSFQKVFPIGKSTHACRTDQ
jgi:hypothetical protein